MNTRIALAILCLLALCLAAPLAHTQGSQLVDENYEDYLEVRQGQTLTKTWTLRNLSGKPWRQVRLKHIDPRPRGKGLAAKPYSNTVKVVAHGEIAHFEVPVTVPRGLKPGVYDATFKLVNPDGSFTVKDTTGVWVKWVVVPASPPKKGTPKPKIQKPSRLR